jgi:uncharacterized protein YndB with AHSA1/START domain
MGNDIVIGARAEVELIIGLAPEDVWDLITDVTRVGEWSPECEGAEWLAPADGPRVGARFAAHNRYADGYVAHVECVVTAAERPDRFAWVVLDDANDPERPGSIWQYTLLRTALPGRTLIRHGFEHGPGFTGVSEAVQEYPERADVIIDKRMARLRANMTATLTAMAHACGAEVFDADTDETHTP